MEELKIRKPAIAFLLSLILPGLGQTYCCKPLRGILTYFAPWTFLSVVGLLGLIVSLKALIAAIAVFVAIQIAIAADAAMLAARLKAAQLKRYNRWYVYIAAILLVHVAFEPAVIPFLQIHVAGLRTLRMPSDPMSPTLRKGDHFLARIQRYGPRVPERGEVVVFPLPENEKLMQVRRVIGLPNERIEIKDRKIFIDGEPLEDPWGVHSNDPVIPRELSPKHNFGPSTIPGDAIFVMADNREAAGDSRYWGCVQLGKIEGKALFIYQSDDPDKVGTLLD